MNKLNALLLVITLLTPVASAVAQKGGDNGPVGIFETSKEYDEFMGSAKEAAYGADGNAELQAMIPMLNDIVLNKPVGWTAKEYGTSGSIMGLLSNESIRNDIEMVDAQFEDLQNRVEEIQKRSAEQIRGLDFKNASNLVSRIKKIREQASNDLDAVLLPHQVERLKQIRMQSLLKRRSLVDVLTSEPVKSDLKITTKQCEELRDEEKVIAADLEKEIAKLREKARQRLLGKLTRSQKASVENMIGEEFEFDNSTKGAGRNLSKKQGSKGKQ